MRSWSRSRPWFVLCALRLTPVLGGPAPAARPGAAVFGQKHARIGKIGSPVFPIFWRCTTASYRDAFCPKARSPDPTTEACRGGPDCRPGSRSKFDLGCLLKAKSGQALRPKPAEMWMDFVWTEPINRRPTPANRGDRGSATELPKSVRSSPFETMEIDQKARAVPRRQATAKNRASKHG